MSAVAIAIAMRRVCVCVCVGGSCQRATEANEETTRRTWIEWGSVCVCVWGIVRGNLYADGKSVFMLNGH